MKIKTILVILVNSLIVSTIGQNPTLELSFTAIDSASYIQLDSLKVMNRSQGGDTLLYWPDTVLVLDLQTGIHKRNSKKEGFQVFQNYPNPVTDQTTISLFIPEMDQVNLIITDLMGRVIINSDRLLDKGTHFFRLIPGEGDLYFFSAQWRGNSSSIKILPAVSKSYGPSSLEYIGCETFSVQLKATEYIQSFLFNIGDELLYIGYTNNLQTGILGAPESSEFLSFQFAYDIPCPGSPTVIYEGQEYNTVQIFNQCWLKDNLNVGTMIQGIQNMTDNGIIEKYCYDNHETNCDLWGGLYQWDEMMKYSIMPSIQGICPPDWHIPTDEEWKVVEGAIDSQYGIGDPEWDGWDMRGSDIGHRIKSQSGWEYNLNGNDSHGFTMLPGGFRYFNDGNFHHSGGHANLWSSSEHTDEYKWFRFIIGYIIESYRNSTPKENGYNVRCIKN